MARRFGAKYCIERMVIAGFKLAFGLFAGWALICIIAAIIYGISGAGAEDKKSDITH